MTASAPLPLGIPARSLRKRRPVPARPGMGRLPLLAAAVAASALAASPAIAKKRPEPGYEATLPVAAPASRPADGSIFSASSYAPLYVGTRAHAVGDVLTIRLIESTTTAKTVGSKSQRTGGASITPPTAGPLSVDPGALKASNDSNFNGAGNASQTNSLGGVITVTIVDVRPNGTALVRGEKQMMLSQGDEWIQLSGIVRLTDIDEDNVVLSSRVADARIEYSGKGALQQATKQGWLGRIFNIIAPF